MYEVSQFSIGLNEVSIFLGEAVGFIGVAIMLIGVAKGIWLFITRQILGRENVLSAIRIELGQFLALGLEFLVGKDIIESLVDPTWDDLGKLAVIIALRTVLTIFLEKELKDVAKDAVEEKALRAALKKHGK